MDFANKAKRKVLCLRSGIAVLFLGIYPRGVDNMTTEDTCKTVVAALFITAKQWK
jgi:hypothetical protein